MGQNQSGLPNQNNDAQKEKEKKAKKYEQPAPTRIGKKKKKKAGGHQDSKLPVVVPHTKCKLKLLKLERVKDYLLMEEEFIQNQERLRPAEEKTQEERSKVDDLRGTPMGVGTLEEMIDDNHAIVSSSVGPEYYVNVMTFVDKDQIEPGCSVLMHNKVLSVVGLLADDVDPMVSVMKVDKAPLESYADIGGLESQIQEIKVRAARVRAPARAPRAARPGPARARARSPAPPRRASACEAQEAVELPMTHPELYEEVGIKPPKGVILYGEPGTGKTLLAKAVANQTAATFLRVVGSELIQKYLGDGPKLVRELFRVAEEHAPSIVFIDEIDAVGTKRCALAQARAPPPAREAVGGLRRGVPTRPRRAARTRPRLRLVRLARRYDATSGGEREIQRTMLELLNQLDGFDSRADVKVILATNKIESLDPALIRPGRIDRKIEFPMPDVKTKRHIFGIHTTKMTLAEDVNLEEFVMSKDELSGADIKAVCTEAGLLALRERRMKVSQVEFRKAKENVLYKKKGGHPEGLYL